MSLTRIILGDITNILPNAAEQAENCGDIIFEQRLCERRRIKVILGKETKDIPFKHNGKPTPQEFLERVETFLKSRDAYVVVTYFAPKMFGRYELQGRFYKQKPTVEEDYAPSYLAL